MVFRIIAGLLGVFFVLQSLQWLLAPEAAAEALGMPLLDGMGRSSQIGDFGGFFLCIGGFALYGLYLKSPAWMQASAGLLGSAALMRTVAWAVHDAPFAAFFIVVELVCGALLCMSGMHLQPKAQPDTQ